jgi:hypothetical protein
VETVENVNGLELFLSDTSFFATLGTTDGDASPFYVLKVTTVPTALTYRFDTPPNDQPIADFLSPLTGEPLIYSGDNITTSLTDLNFLASNAAKVGTAQAKYISSSGTGSYIHEFVIEHVFQNIYFVENWLSNYENASLPVSYQGLNSYRYVSEMNFSTNVNDPNQGKIFLDDFLAGVSGLFNQNFNAGVNHYQLESVSYAVGGFPSVGIDIDETTSVTIQLSKDNGNFSAGEIASLYCSKLPESAAYNISANTMPENFVLASAFATSGAVSIDSDYIKNYTVLVNSGDNSLIDITFDLEYTTDQKALINNNDSFYIGVGLEDLTIANYLSDRVNVWVDFGKYIKTPDVLGLISKNQINVYNSQQEPAISTPSTNIDAWVNTVQFVSGNFSISKYATGQQTKLKNFKVQVVAYNGADFFRIQEYVFQISPVVPFLALGSPSVNFDLIDIEAQNTLGIPADEPFNKAILTSAAPSPGDTEQRFDFSVGFEISWRDWAELETVAEVAPEFYDITKDFDGFNGNTSNYSNVNGYNIYIFAKAVVNSQGADTTYNMVSDRGFIYNFDVDAVFGWSAVTKFYDESGDETNDIFIGQDITVEITMDNPGILVTPAVSGAEIVVEVSGSTNRDYRLHSNKDWSEPENFLKGESGGDYVTHTQIAGTPNKEVLTCVLKKEKILLGNKYNFYGHLNWDT